MSQTYSCRPSQILSIPANSPAAFHLDRAVMHFGNAMESDLQRLDSNAKLSETFKQLERSKMFAAWLDLEPDVQAKGQYADPAMKFIG